MFDSWLATAHRCYQLAKFRLSSDPNTMYDQLEESEVKKEKFHKRFRICEKVVHQINAGRFRTLVDGRQIFNSHNRGESKIV